MRKARNNRVIFVILALMIVYITQCQQKKKAEPVVDTIEETLLDQYVYSPDASFHYEIAYQGKKDGYTFYVLKMISQEWLTEAEVDEPAWWHWIRIVVPDTIKHNTGMMMIGGGAKDDDLPEEPGQILEQSALLTHSVTADIHNIPNQPLAFKGDDYGPRFEDELIAYGWKKFLEGGAQDEDAIWLARLPMTKAVVRAMDAVSKVVSGETNSSLDRYMVAGGSKRGWTTWTTAAVDDRVVAIVPIVIDLLNVVPSFDHHWRNYGFWAPAVGNYVEEGIMDWMHTNEFARLLEITEPYSYLDRYDIPKLLLNATGDQFFQPDSWKFYWDDLPDEKYVRYVPNTGHSLKESDAIETLISYYQYIIDKDDRPQFEWSVKGSHVHITTDPQNPPTNIKLWQAASHEKSRDFRIDVIGKDWTDSTLSVQPSGKYHIDLAIPSEGWKAYFVELTFKQQDKLPLKLTTGVSVLPEVYPFEPFVSQKR
jgi:PhoPQ-activated pathogenicity-related protein